MFQKVFLHSSGRLRPGWRFLIAAIAMIVVQIGAGALANRLAPASHNILFYESLFRPLALVVLIAVYGAMVKVADVSESGPFAGQGFVRDRWASELLLGLFLGAFMILLSVAAIKAAGRYHMDPVVDSSIADLVLVFWILLAAAALEEVTFRGYPFQKLVEGIGPWVAAVALSGLFGALHLFNPNATFVGFLNTVLVGLQLSYAYLRTRALWLPIGIHFAWNFTLGTVFGLPVSGLNIFAVVTKGSAGGPAWLTGGDYGIEASLTGTVTILLGIAGVHLFTRSKSIPPDVTPGPV